MGELSINKKIGKTMIVMDTCAYESLTKGIVNDVIKKVVISLLQPNSIGVISDLSLAELIEGRKTLEEFNKLRDIINQYGISIFGHSNILSNCGDKALNESFGSQEEYESFRKNIISLKHDYIKPVYIEVILKYLVLFVTVLAYSDKDFFAPFCKYIIEMFEKNMDELKSIIEEYFDLITKEDEKTKKESLYDFCSLILETIATIHKPGYVEGEISKRLSDFDVLNKLSSITTKAVKKMMAEPLSEGLAKKNNVLFLMSVLSKNKAIGHNESKIIFDGTSYAVVMSGFCQGKFQYNDLVDLCNVSLMFNETENIRYFTTDNRWLDFINLEKEMGVIPK